MKITTMAIILVVVLILFFVSGYYHMLEPSKCVTTVQYCCPNKEQPFYQEYLKNKGFEKGECPLGEAGWIALHSEGEIEKFKSTYQDCDMRFFGELVKWGGYGTFIGECDLE